jgi:hypothetical protein
MSIRVVGVILLALVVAAVGGWFVGSSGRSAAERAETVSLMRAEFAESRALVLEGRVSLFVSNFGDAIERFQRANVLIGRIQRQLREIGQVEQAGRLEIAASSIGDAQRLAATFDTTKAQAAAETALGALRAASGGN